MARFRRRRFGGRRSRMRKSSRFGRRKRRSTSYVVSRGGIRL